MTRSAWGLPAAVAVLAVLPFAAIRGYGFVSWDDLDLIVANPLLRASWPDFFRSFLTAHPLTAWQPLGWLLYRVLGSPPSPEACHRVALLLHALNAGLVCVWLSDRRGRWAAAGVALLWAWHPVQAESVAWATMLSDLLCGSFVLLALNLRARGKERFASFFFVMAGLCRWKALAYPLLCLLDDKIRSKPLRRNEYVVLSVISVAVLTVHALAKSGAATVLSFRPHEAAAGLLWQLSKLVWPFRLAPATHLDGGDNPLNLGLGAALLLISGLAVVAGYFRRRSPEFAFGLFAFILCLAPTLAAAPSGPMFLHDHHLYLASAAFLPWLSSFASRLSRRSAYVFVVALSGLGFAASSQAGIWRNSDALWSHTVSLFPRSQMARLNWAASLVDHGRPAEALILLDDQLALYPGDSQAQYLRAGLLARLGATPSARARLESDAAGVHFERREGDRAAARMKAALALAPGDPDILYNAAVVDAALGRREDARRKLLTVRRLRPADPRVGPALDRLPKTP